MAAKEGKVILSLWYIHWWQVCHVFVNNNTPTLMQATPVKLSGSLKQSSKVEEGPKEKSQKEYRGIREGNGDWLLATYIVHIYMHICIYMKLSKNREKLKIYKRIY